MENLPKVRTVTSVVFPSTLPDGNSTFSLSSADFISSGVRPYAESFAGSIHKRIAYFLSPQMRISDTPGMVCNCFLMVFAAISLISRRLRSLLCTVTTKIASEFASAFDTVGGSMSAGNCLCTRATRSRTSFADVSRSLLSENSTVIVLAPSRLIDVSDVMPAIPLSDSSNTSVILDSITSAFAPGYAAFTVMIGGSTAGNSLMPRYV